jgi:hypothetical protein
MQEEVPLTASAAGAGLNLEQSRMNSPLVSRKATGVAMGAYQYVTPSVEDLIKIGMSMEEARVFNKKFTQFLARRHDPLASMTLSPPPTVPTFDQLLPVSPASAHLLLERLFANTTFSLRSRSC